MVFDRKYKNGTISDKTYGLTVANVDPMSLMICGFRETGGADKNFLTYLSTFEYS